VGTQVPVSASKVDSSRTDWVKRELRTTTVTTLTGRGCPEPHVSDGDVLSVPVTQLYLTNVSRRYELPSGPVFVCVGKQEASVVAHPVT
jgi:hypothetical protein